MATVTITNLTSAAVYVGDLYTEVPASSSIEIDRTPSDLAGMVSLQKLVQDGSVSVAVEYTAAEQAAGWAGAPDATEAADIAPVAADATFSPEIVVRKVLTGGVTGTADDVTVCALNHLPFKARIIDAWAVLSAGVAASTLQVRSAAAGGGTLAATLDSSAAGVARVSTLTGTQVFTPGSSVGLFVRRSDRAVAGEIFIKLRREN